MEAKKKELNQLLEIVIYDLTNILTARRCPEMAPRSSLAAAAPLARVVLFLLAPAQAKLTDKWRSFILSLFLPLLVGFVDFHKLKMPTRLEHNNNDWHARNLFFVATASAHLTACWVFLCVHFCVSQVSPEEFRISSSGGGGGGDY